MAATDTDTLELTSRSAEGSRSARRLRRTGQVPGVIYGGDGDAVPFAVDALTLRNTLAHAGALLEVTIGSGQTENVVVKELQRHPVRGDIIHADLLRVRMDVAIQTPVVLELVGSDEAPGTSEGGVLAQETRELTIEALPGDIPESIQHDVSGMELNDTLHLSDITAPQGITFVDDPETVIASLSLPRLEVETPDEVETETEVVGEGEGEALAAEGSDAGDQPETGGAGAGEQPDTTSE